MLLPICLALSTNINESLPNINKKNSKNFEIALFLGIAYASSMGGMSSLIGTAPNIVFAGFMLENFAIEISFIDWMKIALPIGLTMLIIGYLVLTKLLYPIKFDMNIEAKRKINQSLYKLGPMNVDEKKVLVLFMVTAFFWVSRAYLNDIPILANLTDAGIAIIAAIVLFIIPSRNKKTELLVWEDTKQLPWGLLILFGGKHKKTKGGPKSTNSKSSVREEHNLPMSTTQP